MQLSKNHFILLLSIIAMGFLLVSGRAIAAVSLENSVLEQPVTNTVLINNDIESLIPLTGQANTVASCQQQELSQCRLDNAELKVQVSAYCYYINLGHGHLYEVCY